MWPRRSHVIRLQGARFWCNYTSVGLLTPWKIFTQVSHNHSGTAVDTELHTARHTPAADSIISLQRCSGDTSVCHHWLIRLWSLDKWKPLGSASWKVSGSTLLKKGTLAFTFCNIPKMISLLMLSCIFCCIFCILCMCYEPCETFHAL